MHVYILDEHVSVIMYGYSPNNAGGDQMTVARTRGTQRIRSNAERGKERLEGLVPVIEDWHAKMCFLGVS